MQLRYHLRYRQDCKDSLGERPSPHIRYRELGFDSGLGLLLSLKLRLMAGSGLSCDVLFCPMDWRRTV